MRLDQSCPAIRWQAAPAPAGARFSILIPTWNNLPFVRLCVRSLRENSRWPHQLILHINDGSDGTRDWAVAEGLAHSYSASNVGICLALNAAASLAQTDYIAYFNDDMYALPGWDVPLWNVINAIDHSSWFLSATMVEPVDTGNPSVLVAGDYGRELASFRERDLLRDAVGWRIPDWMGATWPPNVVPRSLWELVGGYSVEFSPGMYSDPDFSAKLWLAGTRHFQGLGSSLVYHFMSKSTLKVKKNDGKRLFIRKWGLTSGDFGHLFLRRGQRWSGPCSEPEPEALQRAYLKARFKKYL